MLIMMEKYAFLFFILPALVHSNCPCNNSNYPCLYIDHCFSATESICTNNGGKYCGVTASPTTAPTTDAPTATSPTTASPTTASPTTAPPTTASPTTHSSCPCTSEQYSCFYNDQCYSATDSICINNGGKYCRVTTSPTAAPPTAASPTSAAPTTAPTDTPLEVLPVQEVTECTCSKTRPCLYDGECYWMPNETECTNYGGKYCEKFSSIVATSSLIPIPLLYSLPNINSAASTQGHDTDIQPVRELDFFNLKPLQSQKLSKKNKNTLSNRHK